MADSNKNLEYALKYARMGWHVIPCHYITTEGDCSCGFRRDAESKHTYGKHPMAHLVPHGQNQATTDEALIREWWTREPNANIAINLFRSGLVAVDIDPRNGGWEGIDSIETRHGLLRSDVEQFSGGGGEHRLFALASDMNVSLPGQLAEGVDLKRNGYIMVEPSNHYSGKRYEWEASSDPLDGVMPSPLPDWIRDLARNKEEVNLPREVVYQPLSVRDRVDLSSALTAISADEYDTWIRVGMALHATGAGQEALELWDNWSQTSSKYDSVVMYRKWASFRNKGLSGVTKATVFQIAQYNGWDNPARKKPEAAPIDFTVPDTTPDETKQDLKFPFSPIDTSEITEIDWTVEDYLESDSLALIFGEPGSGKSFVAIDLASCVATGHAWHGHDVKKGAVFYIAGEGFNGLTRRFRAWEIRNHVSLSGAPIFRSHKPARLYDRQSAIDVAEAVYVTAQECGVMPTLIVVDTIARNMGGDENSTQDMNAFIEHLDACLRVPYKSTVLCVHHSGKASPGQARGSSALRGALDAEYMIELEQTSKTIVMSNRKMKDADIPPEKRFYIESVDLGLIDKKGNPITGAALDAVDISGLVKSLEEKREYMGKNQRKIIEALDGLIFARKKDPHNTPITTDDLRDAAIGKGVDGKRYSEALNALEQKNKIRIWPGNIVEVINPAEE